jgi:hypothetical protein
MNSALRFSEGSEIRLRISAAAAEVKVSTVTFSGGTSAT